MKYIQIQNENLKVQIALKGAELRSLKYADVEYLWQADPKFWARTAPILFPIVGKLKENQYRHLGVSYQLNQHGFARDLEFELLEQNEFSCGLLLKSNAQTQENYPFDFELKVQYELKDFGVVVKYSVQNTGSQKMFFQIGAHPGFRIPIYNNEEYADYQICFSEAETVKAFQTHLKTGLLKTESQRFLQDQTQIDLSPSLFDQDYFLLKEYRSQSIALLHKHTQKGIRLQRQNFPYLGIWSPKGCSEFVCLEPWFGHSDFEDFEGELSEKEGIIQLDALEQFTTNYSIEIEL